MLDTVLCILIIGGFFILRGILATVFFFYLLPEGDRCPNCDAVTVRVESAFADSFLPWFHKRWCLSCGWQGMLRRGPLSPRPEHSDALTRR